MPQTDTSSRHLSPDESRQSNRPSNGTPSILRKPADSTVKCLRTRLIQHCCHCWVLLHPRNHHDNSLHTVSPVHDRRSPNVDNPIFPPYFPPYSLATDSRYAWKELGIVYSLYDKNSSGEAFKEGKSAGLLAFPLSIKIKNPFLFQKIVWNLFFLYSSKKDVYWKYR